MKDFVHWVHPESSQPSDLEEGEEEEEMTGLLNRYAARKRKRQESSEREPNQAKASSRPTMDGDSEMQAIVIPGSPEMGSSERPGLEDVALGEPRGATLISFSFQVIHPPNQAESQPDMPKLA